MLAPLLAILILGLGATATAQDEPETVPDDYRLQKVDGLFLDDVAFDRGERLAELYFRALTRFGEPVRSLSVAEVDLREDDQDVANKDMELLSLEESGRGVSAVLLIDNSRTMKGEPFERAKEAALDLIDRLSSLDRIAVVSFAGSPEEVAPFDMARPTARVHVESLEIEPNSLNTTLFDAMYKAVDLLRKSEGIPRRSFVIVLSDGNDGGSNHTLEQAIALARGSDTQPRILVFAIGHARFGRAGLAALEEIARATGADFFEASSAGQLGSFYKQILHQMMQSYVLTFPVDLDGQSHSLQLALPGVTDRRLALYPDVPRNWIPWLAGGASVLLLGAGGWLLLRKLRSGGRLVFEDGGTVVPLRYGQTRIGARPDNDVVIESATVSRYHAEIRVKGRKVEIEDLRSRNGTQVNGEPVKRRLLRDGDRIVLADVEVRYER